MADTINFSNSDLADSLRESYKAVSDIAGSSTEGMREMTPAEQFFHGLGRAGNNVAQASGLGQFLQDNGGLPGVLSSPDKIPEAAGRFLVNIPLGMASAIPTGLSNLYAGISGSNVNYGVDEQTGLIQDEKLDAAQAAASIGTGLVDTLGVGWGGSGSLLREARGAASALRGLSSGLRPLTKFSGAGLMKSAPAAIAFDTLEEGLEEGFQTFAEDVIQKQLDEDSVGRVLESAALGALGGTVMSGAAQGVRSFTTGQNSANNPNAARASQPKDTYSRWDRVYQSSRQVQNLDNVPELYKDAMMKKAIKPKVNPVDGSTSLRLLKDGQGGLGINQARVGVPDLQYMFNGSAEGARRIALVFNSAGHNKMQDVTDQDVEEVRQLLFETPDAATELATRLKARYPSGCQVTVFKNPASKNDGISVNLIGINESSGLELNSYASQAINADEDSDQVPFFMINHAGEMSPARWAIEKVWTELPLPNNLADKRSAVDFNYGGFAYRESDNERTAGKAAVRNGARQALRALQTNRYQGFVHDAAAIRRQMKDIQRLVNDFLKHVSSQEENRDALIANSLKEIYDQAFYYYRMADTKGSADVIDRRARRFALNFVDQLYIKYSQSTLPQQSGVVFTPGKDDEEVAKLVSTAIKQSDISRVQGSPGRTSSRGPAVKRDENSLRLFYGASQSGQVFRDSSSVSYPIGKAVPSWVSGHELGSTAPNNGQRRFQIRCGMGIVEAGGTPITTISNYFNSEVQTEVALSLEQAADGSRYNTAEAGNVAAVFISAYDNRVEDYNDQLKETYRNRDVWAPGTPQRKHIENAGKIADPTTPKDERDTLIIEAFQKDEQVARNFLSTLGWMAAENIIPSQYLVGDGRWDRMPFGDFIKSLAESPSYDISDIRAHDKVLAAIIDAEIKAVRENGKREDRAALAYAENAGEGFGSVRKRYMDSNGNFAPDDVSTVINRGEALSYLTVPEYAIETGLIDAVAFASQDTRDVGYKFLFGDKEEVVNVAGSNNFLGKFMPFLDYFESNPGQDLPENLLKDLQAIGELDIVHQAIVEELLANHRSGTLDLLTDVNVSYETKNSFLDKTFGVMDPTISGSFWSISRKKPIDWDSPQLEDSAIAHLANGGEAISRYKKSLIDNARQETEQLINTYDQHLSAFGGSLFGILKQAALDATVRLNYDAPAGVFSTIASFKAAMMEKGKAISAAIHTASQANLATNGSQMSFFSEMTDDVMGQSLLDSFISNPFNLVGIFHNKNYYAKVIDEKTGRSKTITYQDFWSHQQGMPDTWTIDDPIPDEVVKSTLRRYPAIITALGGFTVQSTDTSSGAIDSIVRSGETALDYAFRVVGSNADLNWKERLDHERNMRLLELQLWQEGWFWAAVYGSLDPKDKERVRQSEYIPGEVLEERARNITKRVYAKIGGATAVVAPSNKGEEIRLDIMQLMDSHLDEASSRLSNIFEARMLSQMANFAGNISDVIGDYSLSVFFATLTSRLFSGQTLTLRDAQGNPLNINISSWNNNGGLPLINANSLASTVRQEANDFLAVSLLIGMRLAEGNFDLMFKQTRDGLKNWARANGVDERFLNDFLDQVQTGYKNVKIKDLIRSASPSISNIALTSDRLSDMSKPGRSPRKEFIDYIDSLGNYLGDPTIGGNRDSLIKDFDDIRNRKTGYRFPDDFAHIQSEIDRILFLYHAGKIEYGGYGFNPNYLSDADEIANGFSRFVNEPHPEITPLSFSQNPESDYSAQSLSSAPLDINLTDREDKIILDRILEAIQSGNVPNDINVNGGDVKWMFGLDLVDQGHSIQDDFGYSGEDMTYAQLYAMYDEALTHGTEDVFLARKVLDTQTPTGNNTYRVVTLREVINDIKQNKTSNATRYKYYDPRFNPHGIFSEAASDPLEPSWYERTFQRLSGLVSRIVSGNFQEDSVLKRRKKFDIKNLQIVRKQAGRREGTAKLRVVSKNSQNLTAADEVRSAYMEFVDEFAKEMQKTSMGSGLPISLDDFYILANAMTVAVKVSWGQDDVVCIDTCKLADSGPNGFDAVLANAVSARNSQLPAEISFEVIPLRAVSYKIMQAAAEAPNNANDQDIKEIAFNAMTHWDSTPDTVNGVVMKSYRPETLTYDEIFGRFTPYASARKNRLRDAKSKTPYQRKMLDEFKKRGVSILPESRGPRGSESVTIITEADATEQQKSELAGYYKNLSGNVRVNDPAGRRIVKVFASNTRKSLESPNYSGLSQSAKNLMLHNPGNRRYVQNGESGCYVLCMDPDQIIDATYWAYNASMPNNSAYVVIPKNVLEMSPFGGLSGNTVQLQYAKEHESGTYSGSTECVAIKASQMRSYVAYQNHDTIGVVDEIDVDEIARILFDDTGHFQDTDPTISFVSGFLANIKSSQMSQFKLDLSKFRPNVNPGDPSKHSEDWGYDFVSPQEVTDLLAALGRDVTQWENKEAWKSIEQSITQMSSKRGGFGSPDSIKRAILGYLENPPVRDGVITNCSNGDCIGLMKYYHRSTGAAYYIPIFVPRNVNHFDFASMFTRQNGEILVQYTNTFPLTDLGGGYVKLSGMTMASDKAMAIVDRFMTQKEAEFIDAHQSWFAIKGRVEARDEIMFRKTGELACIKNKIHFLLKPADSNVSGICEYRDEFRDWFVKNEGSETATLNGLFENNSIWSALLAGETFGILSDAELRVINDVLEQCQQYRINPMAVFGASRWNLLEDGRIQVSRSQSVGDYALALCRLNMVDLARFFHVVGQPFNLCQSPDSQYDPDPADVDSPMFNKEGRYRCPIGGEFQYRRVSFDKVTSMGHSSNEETPGNPASASPQQILENIALYGMKNNAHFAQQYAAFMTRDLSKLDRVGGWRSAGGLSALDFRQTGSANSEFMATWLEAKARDGVRNMADKLPTFRRTILDQNTNKAIVIDWSDETDHTAFKTALRQFCNALGFDGDPREFDMGILHQILNCYDGATPPTDTLGAGNISTVTENQVVRALTAMADNFTRDKQLTPINDNRFNHGEGRLSMPFLPPGVMRYLSARCGNFQYDAYRQTMLAQKEACAKAISSIADPGKRQQLRQYAQALLWLNGEPHGGFGDIWAGYDIIQLAQTDELFRRYAESYGFDLDAMAEYQEQSRKKIQEVADFTSGRNGDEYLNTGRSELWGEKTNKYWLADHEQHAKILGHLVEVSRAASVMSLGVAVGNPVGRVAGQTAMEFGLWLSEKGVGPYSGEKRFKRDNLVKIIQDPAFDAVYKAVREAAALGLDLQVLSGQSPTKIIEEVQKAQEKANKNVYHRVMTKIFSMANGFNIGVQQQKKLFAIRFLNFVEATPELQSYLEINPQTGNMLIEDEFASDPSGFFLRAFSAGEGGQGGLPQFYAPARLALNSCRTGDLAQDHWAATLLYDFAQHHPLGNFLFTTAICKFPKYGFNAMDKLLNWVLPMSAINYVVTEAVAKLDENLGGNHHLELTQKYTGIGEAIAVDAAHFGTSTALAIILAIAEGIQLPDDEKKINNPDEWLIFGHRIGQSWWVDDIFGILLPYAISVSAAVHGHPEASLPILLNGSLEACYSNPFIRTGDVLGVVTDFVEGDFDDWNRAKERYADTAEGAPGFLDWLGVQASARFGTWAANFWMPSFIKELYRTLPREEHSYNRVYETSSSGQLTEAGRNGKTVKVGYTEAQIRRACQQAPLMAVFFNAFGGSKTPYDINGQPMTEWVDSYQLDSIDKWDEKTEQDKNAAMLELYCLFNTSNLDDLEKEGFFLSKDVLYAFGAYLWDSYYAAKAEWEKMDAQGILAPEYLGQGDTSEGWKVRNEMYANYQACLRHISDMYYRVVKNSYLSRGVQKYHMYNTGWAQDTEGNYYATGIRPQGVLPWTHGPGTINDPEGTAGYENDFMSVSAVTGKPLDSRALIPVQPEGYEMPDFKAFSKDGNGNGYSGMWSVYSKQDGAQKEITDDINGTMEEIKERAKQIGEQNGTLGTTSKGYTYRSGGGGGGGYSRRSSGSPSQYVPGISSRNYTSNLPNAATGRTNRPYDTQFDYLRPGVETKGSRDAYKRSDI